MNVRIVWVHAMECMCAQPRLRLMFSSERDWKRGVESEPMLTPRGKSSLSEAERRFKPATLLHAGQRTQHTDDWAISAPDTVIIFCLFVVVLFFVFPSYISGVHHFWVRFLRTWPFFNPTIKVVTFRLRGWCMVGVFLLPAFTRLGHERQDLLSPCDEMHACTD